MRQVVYVVVKTSTDGGTDVTTFADIRTAMRYRDECASVVGHERDVTMHERKVWVAHEAKALFAELRGAKS